MDIEVVVICSGVKFYFFQIDQLIILNLNLIFQENSKFCLVFESGQGVEKWKQGNEATVSNLEEMSEVSTPKTNIVVTKTLSWG